MASASHMWVCMRCASFVKGSPSAIHLETDEHMCDSNAQQTIQNVTEIMVSLNTIVQNVNEEHNKPKLSFSPRTRRASKVTPSKSPDSVKMPVKTTIKSPLNGLAKISDVVRAGVEKLNANGNIPKPPPSPPPPPPAHSPIVAKV